MKSPARGLATLPRTHPLRDACLRLLGTGLVATSLGAGLPAPARAQAPAAPTVIDGTAWLASSDEIRKAFLIGASSMLALEEAYAKKKGMPLPEAGAMARKAITGMSLDQISARITRWYEANPGRRNMPVMGVFWVDMVKPSTAPH